MNKRIAIGIAIMAMAATAVQAATYVSATGVSANWTGAGAWGTSSGSPGGASGPDLSKIVGGSTITLNSDIPAGNALGNVQVGEKTVAGGGNLIIDSGAYMRLASASALTVGQDALGTITMNGGTVTGKTVTVSQTAVSSAGSSLAMHGGTIDIEANIFVGKFATGTLTMDGGNVLTSKLNIGDAAGATLGSSVTLTGGTITVGGSGTNGLAINSASGVLNMGGNGQLIMAGNQWSVIDAYVNSGDITWASGGSITGEGDHTWANGGNYLHTAFDSGANKTTVWVNTIPEPATVGMLGLGSLIVLLVRRMRG